MKQTGGQASMSRSKQSRVLETYGAFANYLRPYGRDAERCILLAIMSAAGYDVSSVDIDGEYADAYPIIERVARVVLERVYGI